jgi:hypothetical protein
MKRHLLWTFDRGSFQWDLMCVLILAFLFLIPRHFFHDVPEFMKVPATESVHRTVDNSGNTIYTIKLDSPRFFDTDAVRDGAVDMLQHALGAPVRRLRVQPLRDWSGRVVAYAIWKEK